MPTRMPLDADAVFDEALSVALFNPADVYEREIGDQAIVYLDHNVWIELRDARTDVAREARAACQRARDDRKAVFPLSYSAVSEIARITDERTRQRHADLVDAISGGITLWPPAAVYALEGEAVFRDLVGDRAEVLLRRLAYSRLPDHLGVGTLTFQRSTPVSMAAQMLEAMRAEASLRSVRWMVDHVDLERLRRNHEETGYVEKMDAAHTEVWSRFGTGQKIDAEAVLTWERAHLCQAHVVPAIRRALLAQHGVTGMTDAVSAFREAQGEGGPRRLRDLFRRAAPSLELAAQMFAARARHRDRKAEEQDFWDFEHAALAPIYADAFVTLDRGLAAVLPARDRWPRGAHASILRSLGDLVAFLGA